MNQEINPIDWSALKDDEAIIAKLKSLVSEIHVTSPELKSKTTEELLSIIKDQIKNHGFPLPIEATLSEPNDLGQRMFLGKTKSPITGQEINF